MPMKRFELDGAFYILDAYDTGEMRFDAYDAGDKSHPVIANWTHAQAHEIADWIKANVPEPVPLTLQHWEQMAIGDEFHLGSDNTHALNGGYFYTKINATHYHSKLMNADYGIDSLTEGELQWGLTWRTPPKLSTLEKIDALPDGTVFRFTTTFLGWRYVKANPTLLVRISPRGDEVYTSDPHVDGDWANQYDDEIEIVEA